MHGKRLAIGLIAVTTLIILLFIIIFFDLYKISSTIQFTSEHLIFGAILLILIRIVSSLVPGIPGGMIIFAAVPIYGWLPTFFYNMLGILLGTSAAFFLARIYKEPLVERFTTLKNIHHLEKRVQGNRQFAALVAFRLFTIPVVDISSYVVGLTKISYARFLLATFIATLPTLAGFYFGHEIYRMIFGKNLFIGVIAILVIGSIFLVIKKYKSK